MPHATPCPAQIIIQKIGAVIILILDFFLKLITCLTSVRKGEKNNLKASI